MKNSVKIPKGLIRRSNLNGVTLFNGQKKEKDKTDKQRSTKLYFWVITVFTVFRLLTDFVCLYNYEFWLSLCKIVRNSVILLLPLFTLYTHVTDKISQQPENCENRNDPDLVQAFLKKWWIESDFKAPNPPLSLRFKGSGCHCNSILSKYIPSLQKKL
jgi:hypothetical protein